VFKINPEDSWSAHSSSIRHLPDRLFKIKKRESFFSFSDRKGSYSRQWGELFFSAWYL